MKRGTKTKVVASLLREGWSDKAISENVGVHPLYPATVRRRQNIRLLPVPTETQLRHALEDVLSAKTLEDAKRVASRILRKVEC